MRLPVVAFKPSAMLAGTRNGEVPARLLVTLAPPDRRGTAQLTIPAAAAWYPLQAAAEVALQLDMTWTSGPDTYRSLERQTAGFRRRYTSTWTLEANGLKNRVANTRVWNGQRYWLRKGMAPMAVPGTSNHGAGATRSPGAVDINAAPRDRYAELVRWMVANAARFGWSAESQAEDWHWRVVCGDTLPPDAQAWWALRTFRQGGRSLVVAEAQGILQRLGLYTARIDGQYGPMTQAAIDRLRAHWRLPAGHLDHHAWVVLWHCANLALTAPPTWED